MSTKPDWITWDEATSEATANEDKETLASKELDAVYHALPDWAQQLDGRSLAANVKFRFEEVTKLLHDEIKNSDEKNKELHAFIQYLLNKGGWDHMGELFKWKHPRIKEKEAAK